MMSSISGLVDAIVADQTNIIAHRWVNKFSVVQSRNNARYFTPPLRNQAPAFENVFENFKRLDIQERFFSRDGLLMQFNFHYEIVARYFGNIKPYLKTALAAEQDTYRLTQLLLETPSLGNFVADMINNVSHAQVSICNNSDI